MTSTAAKSNRPFVLFSLGALAASGIAVLRWKALEKKRKQDKEKAERKANSKAKKDVGTSGFRTGLVWSEKYMWHNQGAAFAGHEPAFWDQKEGRFIEPDIHFENSVTKKRIHNLLQACEALDKLHAIKPRLATVEELTWFHTPAYVRKIEAMSKERGGDAGHYAHFGQGGYDIACLSAGGAMEAVKAVCEGTVKNAYALVRPPGHHAERDRGTGFCIFSNVALAAHYARKVIGLKKVAIVDFDAKSGYAHQTGEGRGKGFNINIPMPPGTGEGGYHAVFKQIILPAVDDFAPDIIIVSCGFDASAMDPLSAQLLSSDAYLKFTQWLLKLADKHCAGRIVFVHEGGYSPSTVPYCGLTVIETLMDESFGVWDPFKDEIQNYGYQALQPHQQAVIDDVLARMKADGKLKFAQQLPASSLNAPSPASKSS